MGNRLVQVKEGVVGASLMAVALVTPFLRSRRTTWGASTEEVSEPLPGDHIIEQPRWQYTQAITVNSTPDRVWPWLVQLGQGRGGFYSYEMLENLVGCNIHNADRIIPECQHLEAGDRLMLHPKVPFPVAQFLPGKAIVLHYDTRTGQMPVPGTKAADYFESTWLFFLEAGESQKSRLISRFRIDYSQSVLNRISYGYLVEPISTTMQKQMLKGIKKRAEAI